MKISFNFTAKKYNCTILILFNCEILNGIMKEHHIAVVETWLPKQLRKLNRSTQLNKNNVVHWFYNEKARQVKTKKPQNLLTWASDSVKLANSLRQKIKRAGWTYSNKEFTIRTNRKQDILSFKTKLKIA